MSVSRLVGQSVSRKFNYVNRKNLNSVATFLEWVRVDLKTFLGSAIPNQC